jgi:hypothetical protein
LRQISSIQPASLNFRRDDGTQSAGDAHRIVNLATRCRLLRPICVCRQATRGGALGGIAVGQIAGCLREDGSSFIPLLIVAGSLRCPRLFCHS